MTHNQSNVKLSQSSSGMKLKSLWGAKQSECTIERARSSSVRSRVSCRGSCCAASSSSHSAIEAADLLRDFPPGTAGSTRLLDRTYGCSQAMQDDPPLGSLLPQTKATPSYNIRQTLDCKGHDPNERNTISRLVLMKVLRLLMLAFPRKTLAVNMSDINSLTGC